MNDHEKFISDFQQLMYKHPEIKDGFDVAFHYWKHERERIAKIIFKIVELKEMEREPFGSLVTQDRIDGYNAACEHILQIVDPVLFPSTFPPVSKKT